MPQYQFIHPVLAVYSLASTAYFPIGLGLLYFRFHVLAAIFLTSSVLFILYTRRSTARRYLVDPRHYRPPRNVKLSHYLATRLHILDYLRGTILCLCPALAASSFDTLGLGLLAATAAAFPAMNIYPAIEGLVKFHFDWSFRIVLFRRYASRGALAHKRYVMPLCGLYGQVLLFTDETLSGVWEGVGERRARWVISETYQPLVAERDAQAWRPIVEEQLRFADFVVIDWSHEVSSNMEWELAATLKLLPPSRIIVLAVGENAELARRLMMRLGFDPQDFEVSLTAPPCDAITNLFFIFKMHETMSALKFAPRPAVPAASLENI